MQTPTMPAKTVEPNKILIDNKRAKTKAIIIATKRPTQLSSFSLKKTFWKKLLSGLEEIVRFRMPHNQLKKDNFQKDGYKEYSNNNQDNDFMKCSFSFLFHDFLKQNKALLVDQVSKKFPVFSLRPGIFHLFLFIF